MPEMTGEILLNFNYKMRHYNTRKKSLASSGITQMANTPEAPPALQSELANTQESPPVLQSELESLHMQNATQQAHLATLIDQLQQQCLPPPLVPADTASVANLALLSAISGLSNTLIKVSSNNQRSRKTKYKTRKTRLYTNSNYCWTHGCDIHNNHTSTTGKHQK